MIGLDDSPVYWLRNFENKALCLSTYNSDLVIVATRAVDCIPVIRAVGSLVFMLPEVITVRLSSV